MTSPYHPLTDMWWNAANTRLTKLRVSQALIFASRRGVTDQQLKEKCPPPKSHGALYIIARLEKMKPETITPQASRHLMMDRMASNDDPDFFPTPPWAARALIDTLMAQTAWRPTGICWEPAAGRGHLVMPLMEYFDGVYAADLFEYEPIRPDIKIAQEDFLNVETPPDGTTAIITNPPFADKPRKFLHQALKFNVDLVALLLRQNCASTGWMHEAQQCSVNAGYTPIRLETKSSRIAIHQDQCKPNASTATQYSWFVFLKRGLSITECDWSCFYFRQDKPDYEKHGDYDSFKSVDQDTSPPPLFHQPQNLEVRP